MRIVYTTSARADLAEIEDYIRRDNPPRAAAFTDDLIEACEAIRHLPLGFPAAPRHAQRGLRRKVHKRYLIFYRAERDTVGIVRILHGARDIVRILDQERP